jgi:hypothetical protein
VGAPLDPTVVLGAVREDIRQTLRTAWIDPGLEAAATSPAFFTAAWSAVRPNVGKSFLVLARALRTEAVDSGRATLRPPDLRSALEAALSEEEMRRVEEAVRAAHLASPKAEIVVHAVYRAVRRERIGGTGREEPPVRRGVPEWQRWMSFQPVPEAVRPTLDETRETLNAPAPPVPMQLLARWPSAMTTAWKALKPLLAGPGWPAAANRLRRIVLAGIATLPHPVELQWTALRARGFMEADRAQLADLLAGYDAAMASQTLLSACLWLALGGPEIGVET